MRFSEAAGRQVVSTSTAETLGTVDEFIVHPPSHAVVALNLKKTSDGNTVLWSDLTAFGADAVTVSGADKLTAPRADLVALSGKDHRLLGKRVLSTGGDDLGPLDDVEFDPTTGVITDLILGAGRPTGLRLIGVGSYAVVVQLPAATA